MAPNPQLMTGLGAAASIFFGSLGSSWASVQSGKYWMRSNGILALVPIIIAGVLAIYGMIVAVILGYQMDEADLTTGSGYKNFSAGLIVGLACLASGSAMASFLEDSINLSTMDNMLQEEATLAERGSGNETEEPLLRTGRPHPVLLKPSVKFIVCLVFLEAIGLYGLIVALLLIYK